MKKQPDPGMSDTAALRDKIVGLSESSGRKSYYPLLQQKIRELHGEIAERQRAEQTLRETLDRISRQQAAMAAITTDPHVFHGRLVEAAPSITARMCHALNVSRAGLWVLRGDAFQCIDKFDTRTDSHFCAQELDLTDYPTYAGAIVNEIVAVEDLYQDPRTKDFAATYHAPHNVTAMLDAPVQLDGKLVAIISFEHTDGPRVWHPDELTFAGRIADQVALILAGHQRRLAEEQLQEAHTDLTRHLRFTETLLDAIPIPVFYKDSNLRYLGCNRSFTELMGVSADEIRGRTARDLWPELAHIYDESDKALLKRGGRDMYESKVRDHNGQNREVIFAKQIFTTVHGGVDGIIGSFLDVTERNLSAKENMRLRTLLANIIDSMPSMLVGVDENGNIAQWNQRAAEVTGIPQAEALGRGLDEMLPWLDNEMDKVREAIARKQPLFENKLQRSDRGQSVYEDVTIYPLITNGVDGAVIRIDDVTEKIRIEEMLIQSEKMLSVGGLAAGMAHEINNPLASIMGNAQVVETRLLQPLPQNIEAAKEAGITMDSLRLYLEKRGIPKMLQAIRASGNQAAQIVSNMLSFSRKSDSDRIPEDVAGLLDKTVELACTDYDLKKNYDFKQITIVKEYDPEAPQALCASSKLQQVFLNLFRNGAEAMAEKTYAPGQSPCFTLRVRRNTPWVRIEIEDNGPGLEEHVRKRIFEPFFTTKPVDKGTGLGLSVSYFIITEGHAGIMSAETSAGHWTRFIIDLPAAGCTK